MMNGDPNSDPNQVPGGVLGQDTNQVNPDPNCNPNLGNNIPIANPNLALLQVTQIVQQLSSQINSQPLPEPVPYSPESGRSLVDFLGEFESFALKTYGIDQKLWTPRLEKYLKPPLLDLYHDLVKHHSEYLVIRTALVDSYGAPSITSPADLVDEFNATQYESQGGIRGFVSRLNALATKIFVGHPPDSINEMVKRRCVDALPPYLKNPLKYWSLSNTNASLQEFMRAGSELEKSTPVPSAAAAACVYAGSASAPSVSALASNHVKASPTQASIPSSIAVTPKSPQQQNAASPRFNNTNDTPHPPRCSYCKRRGHTYDNCYLRRSECFNCGQKGHYASRCPNSAPSSSNPTSGGNFQPYVSPSSSGSFPPPSGGLPRTPVQSSNFSNFNSSSGQFSSMPSPLLPTQNSCLFCGVAGHNLCDCPAFADFVARLAQRQSN